MDKSIATAAPYFDAGEVGRELVDFIAAQKGAVQEARPAVLGRLKELLRSARTETERQLAADGKGRRCAEGLAEFQDELIRLVFDYTVAHVYQATNPSNAERMAIVAVGGYGRGRDGALLRRRPAVPHPLQADPLGREPDRERALLPLGPAAEGRPLGRAPSTTACGSAGPTSPSAPPARAPLPLGRRRRSRDGSTHRLWSELFAGTGAAVRRAQARRARRAPRRQGSSRYLLEPNVKEGKGGLRDLQTLFWIAKYLNHAESAEDLVQIGVFTPEEYRIFAEGEAFLWTTRVHLHLLTGRASEQLTFDTQVEIAATLGYRSTEGQRAVERFMQDYFTHAKHVGDLTRIFLAALEARHVKPRPSLGSAPHVFAFAEDRDRPRLPPRDTAGSTSPTTTPSARTRSTSCGCFEEGLATDIPIHPDALRRVAANLRPDRRPGAR